MYKKGKFSAIEMQQLSNAIQAYKDVRLATSKAKLPLTNKMLRKTGLMTRVSLILCLLKMTKRRIPRSGLRSVRTQLQLGAQSNIITATAVPMRPIIAVYHHVRRTSHPLRGQGKWVPSEDALLKAYARCDA